MIKEPIIYTSDTLDAERFPKLAEFRQIWDAKRGDRFAPAWRELDFSAFPPSIIPYMYLLDVSRDPLDFRYRFLGTAVCEIEGQDPTGKSVDEVRPLELAHLARTQFENFTDDPKPTFFMMQEQEDGQLTLGRQIYGGLRLPLSSDGVTMDQFVVLSHFEQQTHELRDYFSKLTASYEK